MKKLVFYTPGCAAPADSFGCASFGMAGICGPEAERAQAFGRELEALQFNGSYAQVLEAAEAASKRAEIRAAIVLFGNAGGENEWLSALGRLLSCPIVGGGAAMDPRSGRGGLITGGGEVSLLLITDARYTYATQTCCIHEEALRECELVLANARELRTIDGVDAARFLADQKRARGISEGDFEHMTLTDAAGVNAHLSCDNGVIRSGRDLDARMTLRCVAHARVYEQMRAFYQDEDAIVFGCAGLRGILDADIPTKALGLFLFGEVCMTDGGAEFGNLMLSKLKLIPKA